MLNDGQDCTFTLILAHQTPCCSIIYIIDLIFEHEQKAVVDIGACTFNFLVTNFFNTIHCQNHLNSPKFATSWIENILHLYPTERSCYHAEWFF